MSKVINLTEKELANELLKIQTIKGMPIFASIVQATTPKCTKKNRINGEINQYKEIKKVSTMSVLLNSDYVKAVTNQLARENKESSEYKQGVNTNPITFGENNQFIGIDKNGEYMLQYRPNDNVKAKVVYYADKKEVSKESIEGFLPKPKTAINQGTDREILWRKVYLKNILQITVNHITYNLIKF